MNTKNVLKRGALAIAALTLISACASIPGAPVKKEGTKMNPKMPELKAATVKALWIPTKIESDRWEEGHYLYVIDKPSTFKSE